MSESCVGTMLSPLIVIEKRLIMSLTIPKWNKKGKFRIFANVKMILISKLKKI